MSATRNPHGSSCSIVGRRDGDTRRGTEERVQASGLVQQKEVS